jgi:hypothetical protein
MPEPGTVMGRAKANVEKKAANLICSIFKDNAIKPEDISLEVNPCGTLTIRRHQCSHKALSNIDAFIRELEQKDDCTIGKHGETISCTKGIFALSEKIDELAERFIPQ